MARALPTSRLAPPLLALLVPLLLAFAPADIAPRLVAALAAREVPAELTVTYRAMHPLHGGNVVEIGGDGTTLRTSRRRGGEATVRQGRVGQEELLELVALLVELEAWEQRVPERAAVPDEGRATLEIRIGSAEGGFWEWYNDMGEHDRLLRLSVLMTELAP